MTRYFVKMFYKPMGKACRFYRQLFDTWDDALAFVVEYRSAYDVMSVEIVQLH